MTSKLQSIANDAAEVLGLTPECDGAEIHSRGIDIFLKALSHIHHYVSIEDGLLTRELGLVPDSKKKNRLFSSVFHRHLAQKCIGAGTIQQGRAAGDYKALVVTDGWYVVEQYPDAEYIADMLLIDLNSRQNSSFTGDETRFNSIPVPGTDRTARQVQIERISDGTTVGGKELITFRASFRKPGSNSQGQDDEHNRQLMRLHRLLQINAAHHGLDIHSNKEFLKYFRLNKGQSLFESERLKFTGETERSLDYMKRRLRHLKRKGWEEVELAQTSDVDHFVGRSKVWMNSLMFTIHCSHSWNQKIMFVRRLFGCWGYGHAKIKYVNGN